EALFGGEPNGQTLALVRDEARRHQPGLELRLRLDEGTTTGVPKRFALQASLGTRCWRWRLWHMRRLGDCAGGERRQIRPNLGGRRRGRRGEGRFRRASLVLA